jgi:hypothetical protein
MVSKLTSLLLKGIPPSPRKENVHFSDREYIHLEEFPPALKFVSHTETKNLARKKMRNINLSNKCTKFIGLPILVGE